MFKQAYIFISILFAAIQLDISSNGEQTNLCYLKKQSAQHILFCVQQTSVSCCVEHLSVISIEVYGDTNCGTANKCESGDGCCTSKHRINDFNKTELIKTFTNTQCFTNVTLDQLPPTDVLSSINVSYTCAETNTNTTPKQTQATTSTETNTSTTSKQTPATTSTDRASVSTTAYITTPQQPTDDKTTTILDTDSSSVKSETGDDSKTNVAAAVAVPFVILLVIVAVVGAVFFIRHRRAATKGTDQSVLKLDDRQDRQDPALPPSYDESINSEYAEIGGNRNSNLVGESNDYSTISPRHLPPVATGHIPFGQRATNEDYDHIGMKPPAKGKGGDTYTHIDHGALKKQHVSNGDVVTDTFTYAQADHDGQSGYRTNTEYVGGETYAHIDHGALQEHDRKDRGFGDPSSAPSVHTGRARSASEESHYDHTGQNAPHGNQDDGDYSHV